MSKCGFRHFALLIYLLHLPLSIEPLLLRKNRQTITYILLDMEKLCRMLQNNRNLYGITRGSCDWEIHGDGRA